MRICQHHFHSEGEDIHKDTGKELWGFFAHISFKVLYGTVRASVFYFIMSLNRVEIGVPER